jgi:phosphoribosylglycinamide formyltransferase-1
LTQHAARPGIAVLISGQGTNLQALIDAAAAGSLGATVRAVLSDRRDAPGLARARAAGIAASYLGGAGVWRDALLAALEDVAPDLVVLAGFMRILRGDFLRRYGEKTLNIHPSLLPRYPGLDTHARVLAAGDREHGATVHFVTEQLDAGPRVIQYRLQVRADDDAASLAARVHGGEHLILPQAAEWFVTGRLRLAGESAILDGRQLEEPVIWEESV